MKRKPLYGVIIVAVVCIVCIYGIGILNSLWFYHALIQDNAGQYTVGYTNAFIRASTSAKTIEDKNDALLPQERSLFTRFVYKKGEQGEYIAGIPRLANQFSIQRELEQQSWVVSRVGYSVVASRAPDRQPPQHSTMKALGAVLRKVVLEGLPLRPIGVLQVDAHSDHAFALYVEKNRRGLHAVAHTGSKDFMKGVLYRSRTDIAVPGTSYVALQSDVLLYVPSEVRTALERKISEAMRFTKTHPAILESLLPFGPVVVAMNADSLAVGVLSSDSRPVALIEQWMNAEQGVRHPVKKAFALPDKTLGYEYVPGVSNAYFNLNKENNSCLPSQDYDEMVFLCGKDTAVVFSNYEDGGRQLAAYLQEKGVSTTGVLQGAALELIGVSQEFTKVEYNSSDDVIEVWADAVLK